MARVPSGVGPETQVRCTACGTTFKLKEVTTALQRPKTDSGQVKPSGESVDAVVGATLGGFHIIEEIGSGGMGTAYKAVQLSLDRPVAVKVLSKQFTQDPKFVERFLRESKVMSALDHPNVVTIYDRDRQGDLLYFAMEYVDGPSLRSLLRTCGGRVNVGEAVRITRQVGAGLSYAHQEGIVHRDIKPANILMTRIGVPKISDFGIAAAAGEVGGNTLTVTRSSIGTAIYAAPEQHEDARNVDARADIYSLGVMLYEMLTGKLPIGAYKRPSQIDNRLPRELDSIIDKAIASDRHERYQTVNALLGDLSELPSASPVSGDKNIEVEESATAQRAEEQFAPTEILSKERAPSGEAAHAAGESIKSADKQAVSRDPEVTTAGEPTPSRRGRTGGGSLKLSGKPWRKRLVKKITCPNCWHSFRPEQVLFIAKHPGLVGDPVVGSNEYLRFQPSRFNVAGEALDARGFPTTDLACPRCHLQLSDAALEVPPLFISIVGSPASGKSYLLTTMTWELRRVLPQAHIAFTDADPMANSVINEYERTLFFNPDPDGPTEISKTQATEPRLHRTAMLDGVPVRFPLPMQFALWPMPSHPKFAEAHKFGRNVVLYDNAGEDFLPSAEDIGSAATRHLAKSHILLVLFDPTQDPAIRGRCRGDDPQLKYGLRPDGSLPAVLLRQETLLREVAVRIRRYHGMSQSERINKPLIVVVPKFDVWADASDTSIEQEPYQPARGDSPLMVDTERVERTSKTLERVFRAFCPEFVAAAEGLSTTVRYIPVSSLGRSPMLVTRGERKFYGIRPKDISPKWTTVPLLYSLCKWAPGLIESMGRRSK